MASSTIEYTDKVTPEQITTGAGTNIQIDICKTGRVVMILFSAGNYTAEANATLATIPAGFRPYYVVDFNDSLAGHRINIGTNGVISSTDALSNAPLRGSVTYITKID